MKQEFILKGLTCANCAMKIEEKISGQDDYRDVSYNLATQTLTVKAKGQADDYVEPLQKLVDRIEDGVTVLVKEHDHHQAHDHYHDSETDKSVWIRLGVGGTAFLLALLLPLGDVITFGLFLVAYLVVGGDVILRAGKNILRGQVFDENFLMSIATIGAFAIGEYAEGVVVMLFYQIGELFQDIAVNKSRRSIASLMDIRPDSAWVKESGLLVQKSPVDVLVGDLIVVKPGERVPLDGILVSGQSMVDTSALTGESVPRKVVEGESVLSGSVNQDALITIEVTKIYAESTVARILDMVENASSKKAETEKFITKFARYYTPVVVYLAVALAILPPLLIEGATFSEWVHRALIFLVVSCPCALVISIPLGFFGGIGGASKNGVLIKGGNYLEALYQVDTIVFDKTGTLTKGVFKVTDVAAYDGSEEALIKITAVIESQSNHPIAKSVLAYYGKDVAMDLIDAYKEIPGKGLVASIEGTEYFAGNDKLMKDNGIDVKSPDTIGTIVYVGSEGKALGHLVISDEIKEDSASAIKQLRALGIKEVHMLTGDHQQVADAVGISLGIGSVYAELLPEDKMTHLEQIISNKKEGKVLFVGDGINDAPVLARADVGVAMGGVGSDAAIEAADVVLMTDEPSKLVDSIKIARKTRNIVWQNIGFAMGVKILVLILGAGGLASMWEAVFADVGVALIAIINAMRIIRKPI